MWLALPWEEVLPWAEQLVQKLGLPHLSRLGGQAKRLLKVALVVATSLVASLPEVP
jgi:hypothetical protein